MPINRDINVNLKFNANAKEAQAQITQLQNSLTQLAKNVDLQYSFPNGNQMKDVSNAALELQQHLTKAFNVKTGNLDLSKLSASLSKSGKTLRDYRDTLAKIGPEGTKAFSEVTNAIALAEKPVITMNEKMGQFLTTLKNTAKWQISSSILHGFMGAIQSAYGYAQDLNESLNNIRIVTGKSTDEMADFAKQANEAAKALSTTTTQYTDAALIFYQQGLDGEAVTQRADTVIKLANVTRQSAEDVSSYMTAVWNNFYDGSESLEHYADVITALGAATASSSAEIATGLEKFASIASTVGLSYDYATTALATVVAQTRQSADIVGTAFKTLFARIQDLELGKTLEDGTDLGKYSQALDTIGVQIKDVNGNVREMDDILDDMGAKWKTIDKATQIAVAQTVAGTRQYTQLIALMDNWDKFQSNLGVAQSSEGTLSEQANIYAESWEAAQKRVKASMQGLYDNIIDDKFFITMTNGIARLIEGIDGLVKGFGGVPGILLTISSVFMQNFAHKMPEAIQNLTQGWKVFTGSAERDMIDMQSQVVKLLDETVNQKGGATNPNAANDFVLSSINKAQIELNKHAKELTETERQVLETKIDFIKELGEEVKLRARNLELSEQELKNADAELKAKMEQNSKSNEVRQQELNDKFNDPTVQARYAELSNKAASETTNAELIEFETLQKEAEELEKINKLLEERNNLKQYHGFNTDNFSDAQDKVDAKYLQEFKDNSLGANLYDEESITTKFRGMTQKSSAFESLSNEIENQVNIFKEQKKNLDENSEAYKKLTKQVEDYLDKVKQQQNWTKESNKKAEDANTDNSLDSKLNQLSVYGQESERIAGFINDVLLKAAEDVKQQFPEAADKVDSFVSAVGRVVESEVDLKNGADAAASATQNTVNEIQSMADKSNQASYVITQSASMITSIMSTLTASIRTVDTLMDKNTSTVQKITSSVGLLTATIYMISRAYKTFSKNAVVTSAVEKVLGTNTIFLAKANEELMLTFVPFAAVLAAVVAALMAAVAIYKQYQKSLETAANKQKLKLERDEEERKSLQETKENLDGLLNSYDALIQQQEKGEITSEELASKAYELCMQYDQESLAIKALSNDYKDLRDAILDVQKANAQELVESSERVKTAAATSARLSIKAQLKATERDGDKVDFSSVSGKDLNKLNDLGISTNTFDQANIEDVVNAALDENKREILIELSQSNDTIGRIIEATSEQYQAAQEANKSYIDSIVSSRFDKDAITTQSDYNKIVTDLISEVNQNVYGGEGDEEALRTAINKSFGVISDEYAKFGQNNSLAELLWSSSDDKNSLEEIEKALGLQDENTIAAIASNFDIFKHIFNKSKDIDEAIKTFSTNFGASIKSQTVLGLQNGLKEAITSDKIIKQDQVNKFFEKGFSPGYSKSEFEQMDDGSKRVLMLQEIIKQNDIIKKQNEEELVQNQKELEFEEKRISYREKQILVENGLYDAYKNSGRTIEEEYAAYEEEYQNLLDNITNTEAYERFSREQIDAILSYTEEEIEKAFEDGLFEDTFEDLDAIKDFKNELQDLYSIDDGTQARIKALKEYNKETKESSEYIKELESHIKSLKEETGDYLQIQKALEQELKNLNTAMDAIQSSYKTLISAAQEYAADGYLTVDTYQALMNMSPEYLACLVNEKGQIDINKEAIKQATIANYEKIASIKLLQIQEDILTVKNTEQVQSEILLKYATDEATLANWDNVDSLKVQIKELVTLGKLTPEQADQWIRYAEAVRAATNAGLKGINTDMDAALGAGKRASQKDKKDLKKYDDEFDRYHDIKEVLEELADAISDVEKQQKHLYGKELAKSLREENTLLEQQEAAYRELGAQQKQEQSELVASLGAMGVAFDQTSGQITNYAQATAAALQTLNDAITTYNASAQTEADKKILETAQKNYDEFKKKLERYDTLIEEIRDTENKLDDLFYKKLDNNLKAWEAEIKFTLDIRDAEKTWKKFINTMNEDFKSMFKDVKNELKGLAEQANHLTQASGSIDVRMKAMQDIEGEIDKLMDGQESSMFASVSEAQEKLKEYIKDLQSDAEELYDTYRKAWDAYMDGIDQAIDRFDDLNSQYERLDDHLDHQAKMIELLYGEKAYAFLGKLYEAESESILGQMESLNKQIEFYKSQYEDASSKWGADSEAAQKWKESWENAVDKLHEKEEAFIEAIQNKAKNAINEIFDDLDKKLTNGQGLELVQQHWQDALDAAEDYYDETERIYQIDRIENAYKEAINKSSDIKTQQMLESIMADQVSQLESKTKLSKYDIELAEKRLAVAQAEAALEEARNNKTSMKVTRGEDGNWSYQYVADDEDVEDKTQAMLDKQNELYEFTKNRWQELQGQIMDITATAFERINELEQEALTASPERLAQINEEIAYLKDYYWGEDGVITLKVAQSAQVERDLNQATAELLWGLYDTDLENYTRMNEQEQALIDQLTSKGIDSYLQLYDTIMHSYEDIESLTEELQEVSINTWTSAAAEIVRLWNSDDGDSIKFNVQDALNQCKLAIDQYAEDVKAGTEAAGEDFTAVGDRIDEVSDKVRDLQGVTDEMIYQTIGELAEYEAYVRQCEAAWESMKNALINAMNTAIEYLNKVGAGIQQQISNMRQLQQAANEAFNAAQRAAAMSERIGSGTTYSTSGQDWTQHDYADRYQSGTTTWTGRVAAAKANIGLSSSTASERELLARQYHLSARYASGGYTGDWHGDGTPEADDGKLAFLHQKELVLNESDTSNILKVVNMVRNMGQNLLEGLSRKFTGSNSVNNMTNNSESSNNTFNITAEFPNATDVDEIREAILGLPNLVSQYVN